MTSFPTLVPNPKLQIRKPPSIVQSLLKILQTIERGQILIIPPFPLRLTRPLLPNPACPRDQSKEADKQSKKHERGDGISISTVKLEMKSACSFVRAHLPWRLHLVGLTELHLLQASTSRSRGCTCGGRGQIGISKSVKFGWPAKGGGHFVGQVRLDDHSWSHFPHFEVVQVGVTGERRWARTARGVGAQHCEGFVGLAWRAVDMQWHIQQRVIALLVGCGWVLIVKK
jgi:hypothetical protein